MQNSLKLINILPQKYIIAIIGDANAGKTTTINKVFDILDKNKKIQNVVNIDGIPTITKPTPDFVLTGDTIYGSTGIVSSGDQTCYVLKELKKMAKQNMDVIICACRKQYPKTFSAVAETSWMYGYTIIWIDCTCPATMSKDVYTGNLSTQIANLF